MALTTCLEPRRPDWTVLWDLPNLLKIQKKFLSMKQAITFEEIKAEVAKDQEMLDLIRAIEDKDATDKFPDVVANYNRH